MHHPILSNPDDHVHARDYVHVPGPVQIHHANPDANHVAGHGGHHAAADGRSGRPAVYRRKDSASRHNAVHDADHAGSRDFVEVRTEAGYSLHAGMEEGARPRAYHLPRGSGMSCAGAVEILGRLHLVTSRQG